MTDVNICLPTHTISSSQARWQLHHHHGGGGGGGPPPLTSPLPLSTRSDLPIMDSKTQNLSIYL